MMIRREVRADPNEKKSIQKDLKSRQLENLEEGSWDRAFKSISPCRTRKKNEWSKLG